MFGDKAVASGTGSTAYGEGASARGFQSTATGFDASASGSQGTATGSNASARGDNSTATGYNAEAAGLNSVALGANSKARRENEVNIGIWSGSTQTQTRILSGLSDGVNDDEAVNVRQLNDNIAKNSGISRADADGIAEAAKGKAIEEANNNTTTEIGKLNLDAKLATADQNAKGYASDVLKSANTYTNHRAAQAENNAVTRSNNYTDNRFGELRKNLEHTEKRLNAGIAGVTALSSIPYAAGNNFSYGIGAGNYQNGNAVAAGVQLRVSQSTNVRLNISWDSAGNNATGVGIAGGW